MKLNTWYRVDIPKLDHFYRYYFAQLDNGRYMGIECNHQIKAVVAMDSWPDNDDMEEASFSEEVFSHESV